MKRFFNNRDMWTPIWVVSILVLTMVLIYVPTFSNIIGNIKDLPVLVVNEDRGGKIKNEPVNMGDMIESNLLNSAETKTLDWSSAQTKQEAYELLNSGKAVAAIIIPKNYSESVVRVKKGLLFNQSGLKAASMETIVNEASGQSAVGIASQMLSTVNDQMSSSMTEYLEKELVTEQIQLSPENALILAQPLVATQSVASTPLKDSGMTSFILGLMMIIGGMLGSSLITGYVTGKERELQSMNQKRHHYAGLYAEYIYGGILALVLALIVMVAIFGFHKVAHTAGLIPIYFYLVLAMSTMFMLYTTFTLLVGAKWSLLINFPLNIMGIMASGGSISLYGLPFVVHVFSFFHPARYIMDGLRSLVYYNGKVGTGLAKSIVVLFIYLTITIISTHMIYYQREPRLQEQ